MARVTGVGGVFLRSADPKALGAWYAKHLGVEVGDYGATFSWKDEVPKGTGMTAWNPFPMDTTYFGEGNQAAMINYRVDDLDAPFAARGGIPRCASLRRGRLLARQLGANFAYLGHKAEAVARIDAAVAIAPGYWRVHAARAYVLAKAGRYDEAADAQERAVAVATELEPNPSLEADLRKYRFLAAGATAAPPSPPQPPLPPPPHSR